MHEIRATCLYSRTNQFSISPDIVANEQSKGMIFYKDSIFAIHLLNGENYRLPFIINYLPKQ